MAGEWIAMRHDLWECPQVVRILSAMCPQNVRDISTRCRIIGALYRTWCIFDRYTEDGKLIGYTANVLNEEIGIDGWSENLQHVGWLVIEEQSLTVPDFTEYFGDSAKRRMKDRRRKAESRKPCPQSVRKPADVLRTTEQNRTEQKNKKPPKSPTGDAVCATEYPEAFEEFWKAYPRGGRGSKLNALRAYHKARKRVSREMLVESATEYAQCGKVVVDGIIRHASSWLNGGGWDDDRTCWESGKGNGKPPSRKTNAEYLKELGIEADED